MRSSEPCCRPPSNAPDPYGTSRVAATSPEWRIPSARLADGLTVPRDPNARCALANHRLTPLLASLHRKVEP